MLEFFVILAAAIVLTSIDEWMLHRDLRRFARKARDVLGRGDEGQR